MYLNQATIIGNLTRDPELRALPSGQKVASFSVATNENYKDKDGNKVESVEYHNCVAWGRLAENIAQYMTKGSHILVQGKLRTTSWEADGVKKYKTEIVVRDCQFGRKNTNAAAQTVAPASDSTAGAPTKTPPATTAGGGVEYPEDDVDPDDIPF